MKILKHTFYIPILFALSFCQKVAIPNDLIISHEVNNVIYFPYDTIKFSLKLNITGGTEPYATVINKIAVVGPPEVPLKFKSIGNYSVTVADSKNQVKNYNINLKSSDYDPLVYDYRKPLFGSYDCILVISSQIQKDSSWTTVTSPSQSVIVAVSKSNNFTDLIIDKLPNDVPIDPSTKTFIGYHYSGSFKGDSIFITYQAGPGFYFENYRGKKIK